MTRAPSRTRPRPRAAARLTPAFRCPYCKQPYGDGAYHGPSPHAPARLCFDCWADQWARFEQQMLRGGDWTILDEALWLICQGFSQAQAARLIGRHRNVLARWLLLLRKFPHLIPDWLSPGGS